MEQVILVDENDKQIGLAEKLAAHQQGKLHRALSIFLFNSKGELLLQQRAFSKYHSGGLWTNTCCSHPRPGEPLFNAAQRRLREEMGISCPLHKLLEFTYRAELDHRLVENEYDHVFVGTFDGEPRLNPEEVSDWKWIAVDALRRDVHAFPEKYTAWFKLILERVITDRQSTLNPAPW